MKTSEVRTDPSTPTLQNHFQLRPVAAKDPGDLKLSSQKVLPGMHQMTKLIQFGALQVPWLVLKMLSHSEDKEKTW